MGARTKARKRALDVLYAAELRADDPIASLDQAVADGTGPTNDYTLTLVRGVVAEQARIDELLASYSRGWTLDRMPAVDRNVLRIGAWEILYAEDVPGRGRRHRGDEPGPGPVDRRVPGLRERHPRRPGPAPGRGPGGRVDAPTVGVCSHSRRTWFDYPNG